MKILFGIQGNYKDITQIAIARFQYQCLCAAATNFVKIPANVNRRDNVFGDHIIGTPKHIWVNGVRQKDGGTIHINMDIQQNNSAAKQVRNLISGLNQAASETDLEKIATEKISRIHSSLALTPGNFQDDSLQKACAKFLRPDAKVVLIGGGINGTLALFVASLLRDDQNLVVYEKDPHIINLLTHNRGLNEFEFKIEEIKEKIIINDFFDTLVITQKDLAHFELTESVKEIICNIGDNFEDMGFKIRMEHLFKRS